MSEINAKIKDAGLLSCAVQGVEVQGMTELRNKAREQGVYIRVLKILWHAERFRERLSRICPRHEGPLAYGISIDPVAVAKVLIDYAKKMRAGHQSSGDAE